MSKVTQSTIARIHGVSRQAVGSALGLYTNSNIKLSAKVRESIIATAKELGYRPNRFAQIISGRKSGVIGVMNFGGITQMGSQNALYAARAIQESGFQLMLYDVTWYQKGGIETVLSVRSVLPALPAIAGLSATHLSAILFPLTLRRLYVARDRDPAGAAAFACRA